MLDKSRGPNTIYLHCLRFPLESAPILLSMGKSKRVLQCQRSPQADKMQKEYRVTCRSSYPLHARTTLRHATKTKNTFLNYDSSPSPYIWEREVTLFVTGLEPCSVSARLSAYCTFHARKTLAQGRHATKLTTILSPTMIRSSYLAASTAVGLLSRSRALLSVVRTTA